MSLTRRSAITIGPPEGARSAFHWELARRGLEHLQEVVGARRGTIASDRYTNASTHLTFRCRLGHEWSAVPSSIIVGTWCPACAGKARITVERAQALARSRGGECLATELVRGRAKVRWRCAEGHEWDAAPTNVSHGSWCPTCAGKVGASLDEVCAMAQERGGACLSRGIGLATEKLAFECRIGHRFKMSPTDVVAAGKWCPKCRASGLDTIVRLRAIARAKGGTCLSQAYLGTMTPLQWRCADGHVWWAAPNRVATRTWCPTCSAARGKRQAKLTIADLQETAESRGGRCLATEYEAAHIPVPWLCASGHVWEARAGDVRHGSWCPRCARKVRGSIDGMRSFAAEKGGRCLSDLYLGGPTPLRFECQKRHRFELAPSALKTGVWCPDCG